MTRAVAIERDGGTFLVELADSPHVVVTSATGEGTAGVADLIERLDNVAATVAGVCTSLYEKAYQALGTMRPDEFELEFGVTLAGEAGVPLVTKGTAECTFKVTATWKRHAGTTS